MVGHLSSKIDGTESKVNHLFQERRMTSKDCDDCAVSFSAVGTFHDRRTQQDEDLDILQDLNKH